MQALKNQSPFAEIGTQADVCIASSETGTDNILCSWLAIRGSPALGNLSIFKDLIAILRFHCTKNDALSRRANARNVSFLVPSRWKFDPYQLVGYQI